MSASFADITPRHMELLAAVLKNLKSTEVDWDTVAADAKYKTAKYARDEYRKASDKLKSGSGAPTKEKESSGDGATEAAATPVKKAATKKRKAAGEKTPVKAKKGKKSEAAVDEGEDAEAVEIKAEGVEEADGDAFN